MKLYALSSKPLNVQLNTVQVSVILVCSLVALDVARMQKMLVDYKIQLRIIMYLINDAQHTSQLLVDYHAY